MGTWPEWQRAITEAGYSAVFMFVFFWLLNFKKEDNGRQNLRLSVASAYFGVLQGLNTTFHSRLLHWPLAVVSAIVIASYVGVVLVFRQEIASDWRRDWEIWGPRLKRLLPGSR
jgi:hypothetical protein